MRQDLQRKYRMYDCLAQLQALYLFDRTRAGARAVMSHVERDSAGANGCAQSSGLSIINGGGASGRPP